MIFDNTYVKIDLDAIARNFSAVQEKTGAEERNGNPLQYFCLKNSMDRGAWWATVHGVVKESDTT